MNVIPLFLMLILTNFRCNKFSTYLDETIYETIYIKNIRLFFLLK
jgi:hypothetical protein